MSSTLLKQMRSVRTAAPLDLKEKSEITASLIIPARNAADSLEETVQAACSFMENEFESSYEIILVPNPSPKQDPKSPDRSHEVAALLAKKYPTVKSILHESPPGKGAALRTGVLTSRGEFVFFTDSDLPYDLSFFNQARKLLESGYGLVTGNRRLPNSFFNVPVHLLNLAYKRHRLGLLFNRVVRVLLPIETTDTQSGLKAFRRSLALDAFQLQRCPGFFFDLEIFLVASGKGYSHTELPVILRLNTEKSTVRVIRESVLAVVWLARIYWNQKMSHYSSAPQILSRYSSCGFSTRFFLNLRWKLTPYRKISARFPRKGRILDWGCGHGLLALTTALESKEREVIGSDHDEARIALAEQASRGVDNLRFERGSLLESPSEKFEAISLIDVMHYFSPEQQNQILSQANECLEPGGVLLMREVNPKAGATSSWNRFYEKIATATGFTQTQKATHHFRTPSEWEKALTQLGLQTHSERCSHFLFADVLFIAKKPAKNSDGNLSAP